jgi:hypothetical protein
MSKSITCQSKHTRSNFHWKKLTTVEGRFGFQADGKGVPHLISRIVGILANSDAMGKEDLVERLQSATGNPSLNVNDLSQPFRQMDKLGILRQQGNTSSAVYSLTANGKTRWETAKKQVQWL